MKLTRILLNQKENRKVKIVPPTTITIVLWKGFHSPMKTTELNHRTLTHTARDHCFIVSSIGGSLNIFWNHGSQTEGGGSLVVTSKNNHLSSV